MSPRFPSRRVAMDTFEAMIENTIIPPSDLYDLDGETFLRNRDGRMESGVLDVLRDFDR